MISHLISVLILAGIKDILIISTLCDLPIYGELLWDVSLFGITFDYAVQENPNDLAEDFIGDDNASLILGDNIFYGHKFTEILERATNLEEWEVIFDYYTNNLGAFEFVGFDDDWNVFFSVERSWNIQNLIMLCLDCIFVRIRI